jgi:uncharacterized lipoprotein YbaY
VWIALAAAALAVLAACASPATNATNTSAPGTTSAGNLSGSATFRSSTPLPSGATMSVAIVAQSTPGAPNFGETTVTVGGKNAPLDFTIPYDISKVDPQGIYSVQATVTASGGQPLWVSKGKVLVITQGRPTMGVAVPLKQP